MSAPGSSSSVQWKHSDYLDSALFLEFDKCRVDDVCARVEGNLYSCEECEYAMKALAVQAYTAVKSGDAILVAEFLDCMACECIILSLKKHAARSQQVATYALSCIVCLSSYSLDLNEYFTELEAMDIILFTISMHMGDEYVSELGTAAAVQLAAAAIRNSSALADGCDIMSQVGVFGLNLRNKRAAYVAMNICYVYSLLAQAVNVKKLVDCGACDLIVTLVRAHESNIDIVVPGTVALCNLASLSFETREALGACGACSLAPRLMRRHPRCVPVLLGGCELIMHLGTAHINTLIHSLFHLLHYICFNTTLSAVAIKYRAPCRGRCMLTAPARPRDPPAGRAIRSRSVLQRRTAHGVGRPGSACTEDTAPRAWGRARDKQRVG